ncbi:hypothetical protein POHY109586_22215 [Polaromonas hydrogenivorans]
MCSIHVDRAEYKHLLQKTAQHSASSVVQIVLDQFANRFRRSIHPNGLSE